MTSLVDRITAVLREHTPGMGFKCNASDCDWRWSPEQDFPAHVAEQIAAAVKIDVERLARALWNADKPWDTCDGSPYGTLRPVEFDDATEGMRRWYRQTARKVLAELDQEET